MGHRLALLSIFAISLGLLIDEIMLSAIFHVLLGAGNTVAAIAIALVGLSAGGIVAYLLPSLHDPERSGRVTRNLLFWFAVSLMASAYLIMAVPISHGDLVYHRSDAAVQLWRMAVYHITVVPFFLGGLAIALLFRADVSRIGRLYSGDLAGAALGCIASPFLLSALGAPQAILVGAVPAAILAGALIRRAGGPLRLWIWLPALLLVAAPVRPGLLGFSILNTMGEVQDARYRSFSIGPEDIEYERWALDAWTIIRGEHIPQQWEAFTGWGLSRRYQGPIPELKLINYNARFSTYVTRLDSGTGPLGEWLDSDLSSLHHLLGRSYDRVLNIGAGGGREVLAALHHGATRVVAVDVSDVVVEELMKDRLLDWSGGLYADPRVEAIADEGRSYAERSSETFDLVEFSIVGGMNLEKMDLVRIDDLFTAEALHTYLERLDADGSFSYVMYSTRSDIVADLWSAPHLSEQPYIPAIRTLTGLRLALEAAVPDARFRDHVLIAALPGMISPNYDLVHIMASPAAFDDEERARFWQRCRALGFTVLHPAEPGSTSSPSPYQRVVEAADLEALAASLPFSIWPATDDRPFHYALDVSHLGKAFQGGRLLSLASGNPLISLGLSIGGLAALVILIPPLLSTRRMASLRLLRSSWKLFLYFACIGFAYMAIEIAVLLKLQAFLGKPIYGLSVGLFAFLLASGIGSGWTGRFDSEDIERRVVLIVLGITVWGLGFALGSDALFGASIALALPFRILIAIAPIFPLALLMGMLFPLGMRLIARESEDLIPWAWATNGCFSVIGIFGARITALFLGFSRSLLLGLAAYLLVVACVSISSRSARARARPGPGR